MVDGVGIRNRLAFGSDLTERVHGNFCEFKCRILPNEAAGHAQPPKPMVPRNLDNRGALRNGLRAHPQHIGGTSTQV